MSDTPYTIGLIGNGLDQWALASAEDADVAIKYICADLLEAHIAAAKAEAYEEAAKIAAGWEEYFDKRNAEGASYGAEMVFRDLRKMKEGGTNKWYGPDDT